MESPFRVAAIEDSELALDALRLEAGQERALEAADRDALLYVFGGGATIALEGAREKLTPGGAAFVAAGEEATLAADAGGLAAILATAGAACDRHAPLGPRERVNRLADARSQQATGARSFQVLFGPHNGSTRATLFAGFVPPGKAPWHYHLYDEIVWIPEGPGRLHLDGEIADLGAGAAFRLRPRQVHIVENTSPERELTVIGVFTPAGSPSAAYLTPDVAAEYRFAG